MWKVLCKQQVLWGLFQNGALIPDTSFYLQLGVTEKEKSP